MGREVVRISKALSEDELTFSSGSLSRHPWHPESHPGSVTCGGNKKGFLNLFILFIFLYRVLTMYSAQA